MEKNLSAEIAEELRKIREEMQKQTSMFRDIAKSIIDELRGIKNEVSR